MHKVDEAALQALGQEIFDEVRAHRVSLFDTEYYTGKLMDWAMADEDFRISLFRFVDVLPSLENSAEVVRHVQEYFRPVAGRIPGIAKWGLDIAPDSLTAKVTAAVVRRQVESMARRFILGDRPESALKALRAIRRRGMAFTVDLLGEACLSESESSAFQQRYLELIRVLSREVPTWKESAPLLAGHPGERSTVNVSVKLSSLFSQTRPVAHHRSVEVLAERLTEIFLCARECGCFVNVDMEDTTRVDITLDTVKRVLSSPALADWDQVGFAFQAYLRRTRDDLESVLQWLRGRGARVAIRLVKGAYWDTETIHARLDRWPIPVWQEKPSSDFEYERLTALLLDHTDLVYPAFGSHNIRSLCHALCYASERGLGHDAFELQTLYGMADPIKDAFVRRGCLVREYAPIGELIPGMAYLVRRLLENTSNKGFIRQGFHEGEEAAALLRAPSMEDTRTASAHLAHDKRIEFRNTPLWDFSRHVHREAVAAALEDLLARPAEDYPRVRPVVGGNELSSCVRYLDSVSPDRPSFVVGHVGLCGESEVDDALRALSEAFPRWRDTPVAERCEVLYRAGEIMEARRAELAAAIIVECGKPWAEADADVAEAIDFCNYYALGASRLFEARELCPLPGEDDLLFYEPRGVCAVIAPWNFPLAIPCGMFAAALVTGNTVALKPAEQSPVIARKLFDIFLDAGLPPEAAAFLPGLGEDAGHALVRSPRVSTIVFTGSKAVGLAITAAAAEVRPGQVHVKRVIAEMGGKNAIIVDADADLDQAVKGVVYSAFGYAGQKCSACSRVIVLAGVYERFLERLREAVASLEVGPATDPATYVGPVIDSEAVERVTRAVAGHGEPTAIAPVPSGLPGYHVPAMVFAGLRRDDPLWRDELFGPVVGVVRVESFAEALEVAMDSEYALTGAVFSRSPEHLRLASRSFRVGNLYLNRGCTGALVGRQPFGGAHMSGVGSKAGGPDYLLQFVVPRLICENTMRQGFAPMDE